MKVFPGSSAPRDVAAEGQLLRGPDREPGGQDLQQLARSVYLGTDNKHKAELFEKNTRSTTRIASQKTRPITPPHTSNTARHRMCTTVHRDAQTCITHAQNAAEQTRPAHRPNHPRTPMCNAMHGRIQPSSATYRACAGRPQAVIKLTENTPRTSYGCEPKNKRCRRTFRRLHIANQGECTGTRSFESAPAAPTRTP